MAYTNNVPQANQRIKDTQQPILNNFAALGTVLNNVDNLACLFPLLGASPATGANIIGLYNKSNALVWRQPASGVEIDFTTCQQAINGWTRLPSGVYLLWGFRNNLNNGNTAIALNAANFTGFPGFTTAFIALVTSVDPDATTVVKVAALSNATLTLWANLLNAKASFLVIGV